jgi:hypothetical protein
LNAPQPLFLPGVPEALILEVYDHAADNEIASGKFASWQSSAALVAHGSGRFPERLGECPLVRTIADLPRPVRKLGLERELRLAWSGWRACFKRDATAQARALREAFAP